MRLVKSTGKPYVSYNSKAFLPEIVFLAEDDTIISSRRTKPCSKVFKKDFSSSLITFSISVF